MKKTVIIFAAMFLATCFKISFIEAAKTTDDTKLTQSVSRGEIIELKNKVNNLESSFYQRVMDDARISLDSAKQATSLVSVASYIFILITFLFGLFGLREWRSISKVRKKAERDIDLVRHFSLAEMYLRNGINSEASREYEEVLKIDSHNLIAHMQLGFLYTDTFKDRAIEHCKKAVELDRNNFTAYLNWGVNLDHTPASKRDVLVIYETAEKLGEAQRLDDLSLGKLKRFIGSCYENLEEWKTALSKYKEAKARLEKVRQTGIPDIIRNADYWLRDLDGIIKRVEDKITT